MATTGASREYISVYYTTIIRGLHAVIPYEITTRKHVSSPYLRRPFVAEYTLLNLEYSKAQ